MFDYLANPARFMRIADRLFWPLVVIATGLGRAIPWAALAQADRLLVREHTWPPRHRRNALFRGRIHDARPPASKPRGGLK